MNKFFSRLILGLFLFGFVLTPSLRAETPSYPSTLPPAQTAEELRERIVYLSNLIADLKAQLAKLQNQNPTEWCFDFNRTMRVGDAGRDVSALREVLAKEGFLVEDKSATYNDAVASAVSSLQEKYFDDILGKAGLKNGNGYVGKYTLAKLNQLYGCKNIVKPDPVGNSNKIKVISPNGGETWSLGKEYQIHWTNQTIYYFGEGNETSTNINRRWPLDTVNLNLVWTCSSENNAVCPAIYRTVEIVSGLNFNSSSGKYVWTVPISVEPGSYFVQVCNNHGGCDQSDRPIKIVTGNSSGSNKAPVISSVSGPTLLKTGTTGTWTLKASDPENGNLTYNVVWGDELNAVPLTSGTAAPSLEAFRQTSTFTHTYSAPGIYTPIFYVTDNANNSAKTSISVKVGSEDTPVALGSAKITVVNSQNGSLINDARVSLHADNGRFIATGNMSSGSAVFDSLPFGNYTVYARAGGYIATKSTFTLSANNNPVYLTVPLSPTPFMDDVPTPVFSGISLSNPESGSVDARQPSYVDGSGFGQGWNQIKVKLVGLNPAAVVSPADFSLVTTGGVSTPINNVSAQGDGWFTLTTQYGFAIPEGQRTVIKHNPSGTKVCLGYLPGDANADGTVSGFDVLAMIDALNGVISLPAHSTDLNRSGISDYADYLTLIDLINGADGFATWYGRTLPACPAV